MTLGTEKYHPKQKQSVQWFVHENVEGVEENYELTLEVSFWVEFPLEAACIAFAAGNLVRQSTAGTGWVFLPLPSTSEATEIPLLPCAAGCDTTGFGRTNSRAFGS